jgi:hypothetical protein
MVRTVVYPSRLEARVAAQNAVNKLAEGLRPGIVAALAPFVGCQVYKADGAMLAKVRGALLVLPNVPDASGYYECSPYGIRVHLKTHACTADRFGDGQIAHYAEATLYVAEVRDRVMVKIEDTPTPRPVYTVAAIMELRTQLKAAKAVVSELESQLRDFGEYDR